MGSWERGRVGGGLGEEPKADKGIHSDSKSIAVTSACDINQCNPQGRPRLL